MVRPGDHQGHPQRRLYILQRRFRDAGSYAGPLDGYATRETLRAVYKACLKLDRSERCDDSVMRPDILSELLVR
ncbi:hypothetical protein [Marimonas lutisalis]|uniref:hypothetical protein n=1 Tax=Marimonas lutisalis TaxID=2545756 RepID=UPI0010F77321|nr:hypothetical protein [Marimonas lutisalis]